MDLERLRREHETHNISPVQVSRQDPRRRTFNGRLELAYSRKSAQHHWPGRRPATSREIIKAINGYPQWFDIISRSD